MTFLGLEKPIEYGRQQIFDPSTAQFVLDAQRQYAAALYNDYKQSLNDMKEFREKYGDFMTPILADQDWWNQNVNDPVKNLINDAYANGVDLLRSPQGRAMVSNLIASMPYGKMAEMRQSAETAKEYLKAQQKLIAEGDYDPDFERFRLKGRSLRDWNTATDGAWLESSPSKFQDVNKWTHHLFDNMELSYDPEESKKYPGYLAYTKNRDTMNKIVDDNIAQLLNTDLGKYYLQDALNSIPADFQGDRSAEAVRRLKDRVVNANYEQNRVKLETDPYALAKENARLKSIYDNGGSKKQQKQTVAYDSAEGLFYRGLIKAGGTEHYSDVEKAVEDGRDNIVRRQIALLKQAQLSKHGAKDMYGYILDGLSIEEAPGNFSRYTQIPLTNGVMPIDKHWAQRMYSDESVVSHMYGISYGVRDGLTGKTKQQVKKYTDRTGLVGKVAIPTTKVRTSFTQKANGEYALRQFWQMSVGEFDDDGNFIHEKYMEFELPTSRAATHNMPAYSKYKMMNEADQDVIIRPSLSEDPSTLGWKNTGSMQVNQYEHVPSNLGFPGTSNNEAYELP